jgi:peptidoglycan L-alanyl-D-glutamate endopeptidase CwlK
VQVERETGLLYGFDWILTSTYRDQEYQDKLFRQGRDGKPGRIVTWTKHSRHTNRKAWDICILKGKVPQWDTAKTDVNNDDIPDYKEFYEIGKSMGLDCGGDYNDWVHFEAPRKEKVDGAEKTKEEGP